MRKKAVELIIAGIVGLAMSITPEEPQREVINLPWEFEAEEPEPEPEYNKELLARVCMSEASTEPFIGKVAVVATVLNRCDLNGQTVEQVVYAPNQYWTGNNGEPTEEVYRAVEFAIKERDAFPRDMLYFRKGYYHNFGEHYIQIGAHFFSTTGGK